MSNNLTALLYDLNWVVYQRVGKCVGPFYRSIELNKKMYRA